MAYQPTDWEHGDIITGGKLNKIEQELTHVADNATYGFGGAQLSSDGLTPFSYINAGDPMPSNPKKGDTVFLKDGNDFLIYSYNGEDWVLKVDPDLSNRIEETIKTASDNTDKAIADNNTQINETINQVAKEQADLAVKDGDFNNKAQAMADKALSDAKANTATVAKSTLDTANQNIADAKKSVTDDIAQEASDRASAVSALDTKAQGYADDAKKSATDGIAQEAKDRATAVSTVDKSAKGYADQAKQDAVDVATSADGVINKKIDDTASSLTSTISQNKVDANGKISTAQSTATQALNGLSTKVEKTDYDKKTGDLTTQLNTTTATATQSKQDIVDIKSTNSSQDSKINSIVSDATKTQQTISDIQKSQSTQSDKLNQITTDVNGTKQEITDIRTKDGQQDTRMGTLETSVSGVRSDFSTYQKSNDGVVKTAQTTAQTAVDGLKTKVSQTDYNAKTGQLSTDVTNVTQTANQAKTDIASIKQTDTTQDARMTTIEADADGTKTTVSNLQKAQNTQSGSISTLQQRADGFDATVTKVDNLAVGGRNYFITSTATKGYLADNGVIGSATNHDLTSDFISVSPNDTWIATGRYNSNASISPEMVIVFQYYDVNKSIIGVRSRNTSGKYVTQYSVAKTIPSGVAYMRVSSGWVNDGYGSFKIEKGNIVTDWTPAPEDVDSATAKAQLTADQATTALNNYKTDADGRITKAQSDITQTAKDVTTKVSQSDYNAKTGDLDTRVTKAQTTADGVTTTVGAYKTSNDNRVKATETSIAQNTKDITLRATTADLDSAKKDYNAQIAQVNVNAQGITSQVSNVNSKIDNLAVGGRNYFITSTATKGYLADNGVIGSATNHDLTSDFISVSPNDTWIATGRYNSSASSSPEMVIVFQYYDTNKAVVGVRSRNSSGKYVTQYSATKTIPSGVAYMRVSSGWVNDGYGSFKIEKGNTVTDWSPAPEDVDNKISAQQITINGITDTVSKQGTNIDSVTKRVTTAEGTLSTATNNISGLQSSVTQTSNQIKTEISDRTKGDSNTLQSSKDFTTSSVSSAVNGVNSTITQTSDSLIAKINTKTDSDTVLSLFKDNWSIGITDNISKITSGIVGNASQMSLISKNVTIDSPETNQEPN
ncbi:hypothetical protein [Leuconostoc mesenteroides]|uniref:hypothetical protein n=1 Tax=Leuconostoc mesenteroides TaxID=1245 RepID=UPI002073EC21|nr:hypothetical protein [Leuconostoc mesenteroides]MCM6836074.1 hypothetical protein [Leuconostoc mesenteroides]